MADAETEAEWAKLRRIAEEKKKAAKALENTKQDKVALSYLEPSSTKVKGFSKNREVVMNSVEKFANASIVFALGGVILKLIARAMEGYMAGMFDGIGMICFVVAVVAAITGITSSFYTKIKYKTKMNYTIFICIIALVVFGVYELSQK